MYIANFDAWHTWLYSRKKHELHTGLFTEEQHKQAGGGTGTGQNQIKGAAFRVVRTNSNIYLAEKSGFRHNYRPEEPEAMFTKLKKRSIFQQKLVEPISQMEKAQHQSQFSLMYLSLYRHITPHLLE